MTAFAKWQIGPRIALGVQILCILSVDWAASGWAQDPTFDLPSKVGIEQRLDQQLPLGLKFRKATGEMIRLRELLSDRPVILAPVYYECPMLCTQVLNGLLRSLQALTLDAGKEFDVIAFSFDPRETPTLAAQKKREYCKSYGRPDCDRGWHFLTGDSQAIDELTEAIGFRYVYDPQTDQFAHAAGIIVVTPEGRLSRYFYGIDYVTRDLRLGLVEAASNRIGTIVDQVLLMCYHYDPSTGKYGLVIMNVIRLAGALTVACLGLFMWQALRRER